MIDMEQLSGMKRMAMFLFSNERSVIANGIDPFAKTSFASIRIHLFRKFFIGL